MTYMFVSKDTEITGSSKIEIKHFKDMITLKKQLDNAEKEYWRRVPHEHKMELFGTKGKIHPRQFRCSKCGREEEWDNP